MRPTISAPLKLMDAIIICVPTPLTKYREPDLQFIVKTGQEIAPHLRKGQLVVLESSTYPGTTREELKPILEATGLKSGSDFWLAYSPEREDPGNANFGTNDIPKVVGGDGKVALALTVALYDQVVVKTVPVSSPETAETVKLTENIFRAVNIALVNELKVICAADGHRRLGSDRGSPRPSRSASCRSSRLRARRALHPDRSVLSSPEGASPSTPASSSWRARSTP
jgi:UDP-N-acetyl-D-glucosamine dehydrogenase